MTNTETVGTSREERMVVIERDEAGKPTIWCDPEIVDLVAALNAGGVPTIASCSGHGYRPGSIALKDGRWLVVAKDDAEHDAIEAIFLTDINGDPITPKHPLSDDGLRAIAGKQFGINDPDLCAQLATKLLAYRTQSPAEWPSDLPNRLRNQAKVSDKLISFMLTEAAEAIDALRAASIPASERSKEETDAWIDSIMDQAIDAYHAEAGTTADWDGVKAAIKVALAALETPPLHKEGEFGIDDALRRGAEIGNMIVGAPVPVPVTITDEMVEGAKKKAVISVHSLTHDVGPKLDATVRSILSAALSAKPGEQG